MITRIDIGLPALEGLKAHWKALEESTDAAVFIRYEWCLYQASMDNTPVVLSAWDDNQCIGILPLVARHLSAKARVPVLSHLCQRFTDYQSILVDNEVEDGQVFDAMMTALNDSDFAHHSLYIPYPDNRLAALLRKQPGCKPCQTWRHTLYRLSGKRVKAKVAREARRRLRKLQDSSDIEVVVNADFDVSLADWILETSARRHGENALTRASDREAILTLLTTYKDQLHLSYMRRNGDCMAAHLGFIHEQSLLYYVPVTDEKQRHHSPGIIMLHEIMQDLSDEGLNSIDYLRGDENYKKDWGNVRKKRSGLLVPRYAGVNLLQRFLIYIWLKRNP